VRALADVEEGREVGRSVDVIQEAGPAIVAALDQVQRVTREYDAQWTWHAAMDATCLIRQRHRSHAGEILFQGV
jgi:hypothetical protein